jgi:hypothetical protein
MVFNATFNNISVISWRSVLLVEESSIHRDITEILLKVALNTITLTLNIMKTCVYRISNLILMAQI